MIYRGTATEMILKALLYKTHSFKEVERMLKKHKHHKNTSTASIQSTLSRLKKNGLVKNTSGGWVANNLARVSLSARNKLNQKNTQPRKKIIDQIIVMYDVPENLRLKRDRMREALEILGFKQKQKSVWIGPAPLSKEFIEYLGELGLVKYVNFFKVREEGIV